MHEFNGIFDFKEFIFCRRCEKCQLIVGKLKTYKNGMDFFFLNDEEVFSYCNYLSELNLSCEEMIIKNIIE